MSDEPLADTNAGGTPLPPPIAANSTSARTALGSVLYVVVGILILIGLLVYRSWRGGTYIPPKDELFLIQLLAALGAALVAGGILGFLLLQASLPGGGAIRAGGGFAVFVLVFFGTPSMIQPQFAGSSLTMTPEKDEPTESSVTTRPARSAETETAGAAKSWACTGTDVFIGRHRAEARTTIPNAAVESFASLSALASTLPEDAEMQNLFDEIAEESGDRWEKLRAPRLKEENRLIELNTFIYAIKREDTRDIILLVGNDPNGSEKVFLAAVVSAIPRSGEFRDKLMEIRSSFCNQFSYKLGSHYVRLDPPLAVLVQGALYYNITQIPGTIGPIGLRPSTSWEVHPITSIEFRP